MEAQVEAPGLFSGMKTGNTVSAWFSPKSEFINTIHVLMRFTDILTCTSVHLKKKNGDVNQHLL